MAASQSCAASARGRLEIVAIVEPNVGDEN